MRVRNLNDQELSDCKANVVDLGAASAVDQKDGELTPTASATGPFKSGLTEITWTVSDAAGNASSVCFQ